MCNLPFILADGAEDLIKVLIGVGFFVFWIISGIISASKKKGPQNKQQEKSWEQILEELAGGKPKPQQPPAPPPVRPAPPPIKAPPMPRPKPVQTAPPPLPVRRPKRNRPKVTTSPVRPAAESPIRSDVAEAEVITNVVSAPDLPVPKGDISATEIGAVRHPTSQALGHARAEGIAKLLTPGNLRNQYILMEILQPPVALREQR